MFWDVEDLQFEGSKLCNHKCGGRAAKLRCKIWQYGLSSFKAGYIKLERFLPKNQHTKWNYWSLIIGVMGRCQTVPKFDFQSQFSMSKKSESFSILFSLKNINLGAHYFITSIFKSLCFLKWCPNFDSSPLLQFSKFNNFVWACWFLAKNLPYFISLHWKLHNRYCHIMQLCFHEIFDDAHHHSAK